MINHARTLLMNRTGGGQSLAELGEEYIPVKFKAKTLPPWLNAYWRVLFGAAPENMYRNYVVDQLLRVVHSTDYANYLRYHDSRLTYDALQPSQFEKTEYGLSWVNNTATYLTDVQKVGALVADETSGNMKNTWAVTFNNGYVTAENVRTRDTSSAYVYQDTKLSQAFTPPGTTTKVKFTFNAADVADWDGAIMLTTLARPTKDLSAKITACENLRANEANLFGSTRGEPYETFMGLWKQSQLPDRIAGLVLAMVWRMNEL